MGNLLKAVQAFGNSPELLLHVLEGDLFTPLDEEEIQRMGEEQRRRMAAMKEGNKEEAFPKNNVAAQQPVATGTDIKSKIPIFLELCRGAKWNATSIMEAALVDVPQDKKGVVQKIQDKLNSIWSGDQYVRNFIILEHPDLRRPLASHPLLEDVWTSIIPTSPLEFEVKIQWEFRSKDADKKIGEVVQQNSLIAKTSQAANFSLVLDAFILCDRLIFQNFLFFTRC